MARIFDPDELKRSTTLPNLGTNGNVYVDVTTKRIYLAAYALEDPNFVLDDGGVTMLALYSYLKEEWRTDAELIKFIFPMVAITDEQFEFLFGWDLGNKETVEYIREGGWAVRNEAGTSLKEYMIVATLGAFNDPLVDQAYYRQGAATLTKDIVLTGEVNQAVQISSAVFTDIVGASATFTAPNVMTVAAETFLTKGYGTGQIITITGSVLNSGTYVIDSLTETTMNFVEQTITTEAVQTVTIAVEDYNYKTAALAGGSPFVIFLREQEKTYGSYDLTVEQNIAALTYKKYAMPLSNGIDLNIVATDNQVDTLTPYTGMDITWYPIISSGAGNASFTAPATMTVTGQNFIADNYLAGQKIRVVGSALNSGYYTIATVAATVLTFDEQTIQTEAAQTITINQARRVGAFDYNFNVIIDGNNALKQQIYTFVQRELRQITDIDVSLGNYIGSITEELLEFVGPTLLTKFTSYGGVYIDNFATADINDLVFKDNADANIQFPYTAAGTIVVNDNLIASTDGIYRMFFTAGFDTAGAILVDDADGIDIAGNISENIGGAIEFSYDYDGNVQRGGGTGGTDAPVTVVAIATNSAQYVRANSTIQQSTQNTITLTAALERNYSNPI